MRIITSIQTKKKVEEQRRETNELDTVAQANKSTYELPLCPLCLYLWAIITFRSYNYIGWLVILLMIFRKN